MNLSNYVSVSYGLRRGAAIAQSVKRLGYGLEDKFTALNYTFLLQNFT